MEQAIGLYLHIPFCKSKCVYCDFFSGKGDDAAYDRYVGTLQNAIVRFGNDVTEKVSSVYCGGGTPSVLGDDRLCRVLQTVRESFTLTDNAEVTLEVNPESGKALDFGRLRESGVNRVSVGLQSAISREIEALGRIHTPQEAAQTVKAAQKAGIDNLSLDLMMGIPYQTTRSLRESIDFCVACGVKHISSYLLKIEKGTPLYAMRQQLPLPDDDAQAELYLFAVDYLKRQGFRQYEISNFAYPGYESRHNTLYWRCGEYIGLGPAAYSFYHGKRFHVPRSLSDFENGVICDDGAGGDREETIMLALRLTEGLRFRQYEQRFGQPLSPLFRQKAERYARHGLMDVTGEHAAFTPKGFLVSNTVLADLLNNI